MHFFIYIHFSTEVHFLTSYGGGNNKDLLAVKTAESNVSIFIKSIFKMNSEAKLFGQKSTPQVH